jgi:hypothetical protein
MADSLNTTNLSRRGMLGTGLAAAGAVSVLGSLSAQAAGTDARVLQLYDAFIAAEERDLAAYSAWDDARGEAVGAAKAKLGIRPGQYSPPMLLEQWEAAIDEQVEALGHTRLYRAAETAKGVYEESWRALVDCPAQSVVGVAIKLAAAVHWDDSLRGIWTGEHSGEKGEHLVMAARADALRLAGLPGDFGIDEPEGTYQEESV